MSWDLNIQNVDVADQNQQWNDVNDVVDSTQNSTDDLMNETLNDVAEKFSIFLLEKYKWDDVKMNEFLSEDWEVDWFWDFVISKVIEQSPEWKNILETIDNVKKWFEVVSSLFSDWNWDSVDIKTKLKDKIYSFLLFVFDKKRIWTTLNVNNLQELFKKYEVINSDTKSKLDSFFDAILDKKIDDLKKISDSILVDSVVQQNSTDIVWVSHDDDVIDDSAWIVYDNNISIWNYELYRLQWNTFDSVKFESLTNWREKLLYLMWINNFSDIVNNQQAKEIVMKNLVSISFFWKSVKVNILVADKLKKIEQEIKRKNISFNIDYIWWFNRRTINSKSNPGTQTLSYHSLWTAIDINFQDNLNRKKCPVDNRDDIRNDIWNFYNKNDSNWKKYFTIPKDVVDVFEENWFRWWWYWLNNWDPMHFELDMWNSDNITELENLFV